jgi:hypothetical protein
MKINNIGIIGIGAYVPKQRCYLPNKKYEII